tara:strand:- start:173 stop:340 length:168 start_codon:yes stop_codon:yes gene_type:complete
MDATLIYLKGGYSIHCAAALWPLSLRLKIIQNTEIFLVIFTLFVILLGLVADSTP